MTTSQVENGTVGSSFDDFLKEQGTYEETVDQAKTRIDKHNTKKENNMTPIFIAFYDDDEGGSRENWNTFHTPWVASTTLAGATKLAKDAIAADIAESIMQDYGIDLATADRTKLPEDVLEEIKFLEECVHIEIQEGNLIA
jgi:hypothetical protein